MPFEREACPLFIYYIYNVFYREMENNSKPPEETDGFDDNSGDWFKVIIIGDAGVGKTSILLRFIEDKFVQTTTSIGYISDRKKLVKVNGKEVQLHVWDTAGQVGSHNHLSINSHHMFIRSVLSFIECNKNFI